MKYLTDFFLKTTNKIKTNTKFQNIKLILVIFQFLSTLALILTVFIIQNNAHNNILKQKKNNSNYYIFYDLSIQQNHNSSNENAAAGGYMIRNSFQLKDIIETTCTYLKYNDFKNIDSFLTDDSIYYNARLQFGFTFIILIIADVIKLHLLLKSIAQSNIQVTLTTRIDNNEVIDNLTESSNGQAEERTETKKESKIQTYFRNHEYIKNGYYFLIQLIKLIFAPGIMFYVFIDFESACVKLGAPLNLINLNRVFIIINYIILFSIVLVFVYGIWLAKNDEENHYSFVFGVSCLTVLALCLIYLTYCFTLFICIFIWGSKISKLMEIMLALSIFIDRVIINLDFFPKAADFIRDFLK
jgi:hypothetical protein